VSFKKRATGNRDRGDKTRVIGDRVTEGRIQKPTVYSLQPSGDRKNGAPNLTAHNRLG